MQTQALKGSKYFDYTNKRVRFEDELAGQVRLCWRTPHALPLPSSDTSRPPPQTTVDDYAAAKSYLVNVTGGVETCQEYCPIAQEDIDLFGPFGIPDDAKDLGTATIEGVTAGAPPPPPRSLATHAPTPCPPLPTLSPRRPSPLPEHFQWVDTILKVIKMETTDFYAKMGADGDALPLFQTTALTPMGQAQIGTENRSWSNFTSGTPPAAKFNIAGVATCPMSGNCGQQSLQLRRLSNKQLHTYARYHTTPPATHGLLNQGIIA